MPLRVCNCSRTDVGWRPRRRNARPQARPLGQDGAHCGKSAFLRGASRTIGDRTELRRQRVQLLAHAAQLFDAFGCLGWEKFETQRQTHPGGVLLALGIPASLMAISCLLPFIHRTACARRKTPVAVAAGDRAVKPAGHRQPERRAGVTNAPLDHRIQRGIAHDAALAHLTWLQFELRFDQRQQVATRLQERHQCRQHQRQRNERQITGHEVEFWLRTSLSQRRLVVISYQIRSVQFARIDAFNAGHPFVSADVRMHLIKPTSTPTTWAAPCCNRQSVNPRWTGRCPCSANQPPEARWL